MEQTTHETTQSIQDEPVITDVGMATRSLIEHQYRWRALGVAAITIALLLIIGYIEFTSANEYLKRFAGYFLYAVIAIPVVGYLHIKNRVQQEFMEQFAKAHGYSYQSSGSPDGLAGALFSSGGRYSHVMSNVISGTYQNCPLRLFNYSFSVSHGKSETTYNHTVFELTMNTDLSDMVLLHGKSSFFDSDNPVFLKQKPLTLEGDFSKYFTLYVVPGHEQEALEIFTPDFMQDMITNNKQLQIEFVGPHIYVYVDWKISTSQDLLSLYGAAEYLVGKLGKRVEGIRENS